MWKPFGFEELLARSIYCQKTDRGDAQRQLELCAKREIYTPFLSELWVPWEVTG